MLADFEIALSMPSDMAIILVELIPTNEEAILWLINLLPSVCSETNVQIWVMVILLADG